MVSKVQNVNVEKVAPAIASSVAASKRAAAPVASAPADTVGAGGTASVAMVSHAAPATGENPFTALLATTASVPASELRLVASAEATSESCEPNLAVLGLLAELESHTTPRDAWGPTKVRNGYMQVTYDAQEERAAALNLDRDASEELARVLVERPTASDVQQVIHAQEWRGAVGGYFKGGDVNAFVQQVLRECYLLGMTDLQLYGDRLKSLNELKKKIREEADRARKVKSEWATIAKADPNWVSGTAYETLKVDGAQVALIPETYTQDEIEKLEREKKTQKSGGPGDEDGTAPQGFLMSSSLAPGDVERLGYFGGVKGDKLRNDKQIFQSIKDVVPKMSEADILNLLVPILRNFEKHGHEGGILELVEAMSPEQRMVVAAAGFGSDGSAFWETTAANSKPVDGFSVEERARYNQLLVEGAEVVSGGTFVPTGSGVSTAEAETLLAEHKKQLLPETPAHEPELSHARLGDGGRTGWRELGERRNFAVQKGALTGDGEAAAGQTKSVDTVAEMEDYLKYLEEQMNSVGDDAQLANIDLQNCLQKQQQTLQMMSNISKVLHDATMAIVRNMNS